MRIVAAFLVLVAAAVALGTFVPRPLWKTGLDETSNSTRHILLLRNPIHTDVALPIDDELLARFRPLVDAGVPADLAAARYLIFGWGSRAFYIETPTWAELRPGPLFKALTLDRSVMHVSVGGDIPADRPDVASYEIAEASYRSLLDFIGSSFVLQGGKPVLVDGAYGDFDRFFEAEGSFNALVGCNIWTAGALRAAGLRTGLWTPLPFLLSVSLGLHN